MFKKLKFVASLLSSAKSWELDLRHEKYTQTVYLAPGDNFDVLLTDFQGANDSWHHFVTEPNLLVVMDQTNHIDHQTGNHFTVGTPYKRTLKFLAGPEDFHLVDLNSEHMLKHRGKGEIRFVFVEPPPIPEERDMQASDGADLKVMLKEGEFDQLMDGTHALLQGYQLENIKLMDSEDRWWQGSDDHRLVKFVVQHMTELHQSDVVIERTRHLSKNVGDIVRLTLLENPSTGYKWLINHKQDISHPAVQVVYDRFKAAMGDGVGVPGVRYITLQVVEDSPFVMHFAYGRPWEDVSQSEQQFKLIFNKQVQKSDEL